MANTAELKSRGYTDALDPNDPLMELSRIIGINAPAQVARPVVADPQLTIEDSFALDLERELAEDATPEVDFALDEDFASEFEDQISASLDLGAAAPSVEPSLEDELNALLMDEAQVSLPAESYQPEFIQTAPAVEPAYELDDVSSAEAELAFDAAEWLDDPLPLAETQLEDEVAAPLEAYVEADPVLAAMPPRVMPASFADDLSTDDLLVEPDFEPEAAGTAFQPEQAFSDTLDAELDFEEPVQFNANDLADFEVAPEFEEDLDAPQAYVPVVEAAAIPAKQELADFSFDDFNLSADTEIAAEPFADLPPAPEFDAQTEHNAYASYDDRLPGSDAPLEQLIARTAPQPIVETVNAESYAVEAVEEFDIPDFEFEAAPEAAKADEFDLDDAFEDNYRGYGAQPPKAAEQPVVASAYDDSEIDFEGLLDEELSSSVSAADNDYSAGYVAAATATAAAVAGAASYRNTSFDDAQSNPDLDVFRTDMADDRYEAPPAKNRSWIAAAALAGVVLLAGGWWAFSGDGVSGTADGPVLVKADPQPVKVAPENPGGNTVPNQDKAVYDKVAGADEPLPSQGQLVSESEEPLDIASVAQAETPAAKSEARVDPALEANTPSGQAADTLAVAPKKVKTFVVKPDGTLVERAAPAPIAAAPVIETVAALPQELVPVPPVEAPKEVAAAPEVAAPEAAAPKVDAPAVAPQASAPVEVEAAAAEPAPAIKVVKTKKIKAPAAEVEAAVAENLPVTERPADQPVTIVGQTGGQTNAEAQAEQVALADPAQPVAAGGYSIQVASTPSPEAAKSTYAALTRKFGGVISGRGVNIQKADVAGKGTVYRVRIPAGSKQEANALCSKYKSAGGSCFVTK